MAPNLDKTMDRVPAESGADATCDFAPQDTEPGGATLDFAAPPNAAASDPGTGVYEPAVTSEGTCDFTPQPARPGVQTTSVPRQQDTLGRAGPTPAPEGTIDFPPAPTGLNPGEVTCDVAPSAGSRPGGDQTKLGGGGATQTAPDGAMPSPGAGPRTAGRYVFKKFHAKGGMGEVWLAEDSDIGRPVALKRILKGRENQTEQFVQEARVTGQLEHPGVIPVHELTLDENDQPFYVMKFVHGQTLKEVIADYRSGKNDAAMSRELQLSGLLDIFVKLCETIAYAHSRGVIHRDIKPDNVMVGAYGETLVLDWGLAKVIGAPETSDPMAAIQRLEDGTLASQAGTIKGTPSFFAPEVAAGEVDQVDKLSDVFLLGGTLYNMITGRPPREGKQKLSQVVEEARTVRAAAPRSLDPGIARPLDAICLKALALKKEDRYQSAAALAEDVQRYRAGDPVSAYRENLLERSARWIKRHRTGLSRAAAAAVISAVGLTAFVLVRDAETRRVAAEATADRLNREEDARRQIGEFRKAAEEARFFAASADPVAQGVPALDAAKAETRADAAFAFAELWGPDFTGMPLENQRSGLREDLYDLLLEIAQLKCRKIEDLADAEKLLERAKHLRPATQSWYRLHARCVEGQDKAQAAADRQRADDPQTPTASLDYYLLGEQARVDSLKQVKDDAAAGKQAGLKGLLARRESLNQAIHFYRRALRDDPNHYWSHFQLGTCFSGLGAYTEAAQALGACIALKPDAAWGYSARGLALSQIADRSEEAEADLNRALQLDPEFRPAQLHRAVYFAKKKSYAKAEADFAAVLAPPEEKRLHAALFARGQMFMDREMYPQARADFDAVVKDKLRIRAVYLYRARISLIEAKPDEAVENLNQFLGFDRQFDPNSPRADEQRGRELRQLASEFPADARNRRESTYILALTYLQKAAAKNLETASLYEEIGTVREKLAELRPKQAVALTEAAIEAYSQGIELAPRDRNLLVKRGWARNSLNQFEEAKDDFAAAVAVDSGDGEAYAGLGYVEAMLKQPGPARRHANLAILYGAGDYLVVHNTACIFGALSRTDPLRGKEYQDMAIDQLQGAIDLWKKGHRQGPNEIELIRAESAATFPPALRARPEFKKLLNNTP